MKVGGVYYDKIIERMNRECIAFPAYHFLVANDLERTERFMNHRFKTEWKVIHLFTGANGLAAIHREGSKRKISIHDHLKISVYKSTQKQTRRNKRKRCL